MILSSSSRMRSRDTMESRSCIASTADSSAGSGLSEKRAMKRAARNMRKGSSPNEISGSSGVRRRPEARSARPAERVHQFHVGQPQRQCVDGEVAPRQVLLDVVAERDVGLARIGHVDLGPVRRDLEELAGAPAPDRSETRPLRPHVVGPPPDQALDLVGTCIGGEIEVGVRAQRPPGRARHGPSPPPDTDCDRPGGIAQPAPPSRPGEDGIARARTWMAPDHGSAASSVALCRCAGPRSACALSRWQRGSSPPDRQADGRRLPRVRGGHRECMPPPAPRTRPRPPSPWPPKRRGSPRPRPGSPSRQGWGPQPGAVGDLRVEVTFYSRIKTATELAQATNAVPDKARPLRLQRPGDRHRRRAPCAATCATVLPDSKAQAPTTAPPCPRTAWPARPGRPTVILGCTPDDGTCGGVYPVSVALYRQGSTTALARHTTFLTYQEPGLSSSVGTGGALRVSLIIPLAAIRSRRPLATVEGLPRAAGGSDGCALLPSRHPPDAGGQPRHRWRACWPTPSRAGGPGNSLKA